jgi:hypothetical protein
MYNSGRRGKRTYDGYGVISQADKFNQTQYPIPIVESFAVTDNSYVPLDDTAVDTAGGQTIVVYGSGFAPGATIMVGGSTIGSVTYLDQGRLTFTAPANTSGSYTIIVMNANGGTGILVPGLVYSGVPTWETSAGSVGSVYETTNVSSTFVATGDAPVTYSILSGSLPPGTSLSPTGVLSGSAPVESGSTTYSFTIRATDNQLQDSDRSFSLTINTDVVTWSTPTNNQVISAYEYAPISNVTASATSAAGYGVVYSANSVPTGITVNANTGVISGTVNTVGNTFTRLTATANTTTRTAIRDVVFNINPDVVTWSSPADATQYALAGGSPISNVSLSATSAAGFGIQYTANALPSGLSLSGSTISGTPTTSETVTTLLTATAETTNRSATRTISWSISLGDTLWNQTTLLLNATTPSTNTFINDASLNNKQLTIAGDTRPSNFNPYTGGYYSNYFDGTDDYLSLSDNTNLQLGSGSFTVEGWFRPLSTKTNSVTCFYTKGINTSGGIIFGIGSDYIFCRHTGTTDLSYNAGSGANSVSWTHVAWVRNGNTLTIYRNGISVASSTVSFTQNDTSIATLGSYTGLGDAANRYGGYVSNFRIIKGTALYTSNFTPPTAPLTAVANTQLLTCQTNRLIDESVNISTITKSGDPIVGSAHPFSISNSINVSNVSSRPYNALFGSGYATTPNFSLSEFTIEFWVKLNSSDFTTNKNCIISGDSQATRIYLTFGGSGFYMIMGSSTEYFGGQLLTSSDVGVWRYIAITRSSSSTIKLFKDGTQFASSTTSAYINGSGTNMTIGYDAYNANYANMYISDFRISNNVVYTTSFTPPTAPLSSTANTVLLTCNGSTLVDTSSTNKTLTLVNSGPTITGGGPYNIVYSNVALPLSIGSAYFDGTGDYLTVPASSNMALGSGDFTIEAWIYTPSTVTQFGAIICNVNNPDGFYLSFSTSNFITFSNYATVAITSSTAVPLNTWTHVAVTRSGTSLRMFFNGVSVGTATNSTVYGVSSATNYIGFNGGAAYYTGYIADCRVIKGTALYTANFLPPQMPLTAVANTQLLTLQYNGGAGNNGFVDQSSFSNLITKTGNVSQGTFSPYSQTGWSNLFNGSGDWLSITNNSALALGAGDFTFECWVYLTGTAIPTTAGVYDQRNGTNGVGVIQPVVELTSSTGYAWYVAAGNRISSGSAAVKLNQWQHIAVSRVSGSTRMYIDGVQVGSTYTDSNNYPAGSITIARENDGASTRYFPGYISNLRTIAGTGLYSGTTITVPTSPLSAVANTVLLTCQDNRFIDESVNAVTLTPSGTPSVQAFSPFGGVTSVPTSYSAYFDGTGDYLTVPDNTALQMGSGNFTIEFWINYSSIAGYQSPFTKGYTAAGDILLQTGNGDGAINVYLSGTAVISESTGAVVGRWYHYALVRSGTTVTLYRDGVSRGTATSSVNFNTTDQLGIGGTGKAPGGNSVGAFAVNGYMSNVRIVKGTAVYTGSFTPPTSPLTAIANTSLLTCQNATFIDNSTNYFTVTGNGNAKPLSFNPFGQTNTTQVSYSPSVNSGSLYFNGGGNYYLSVVDNPSIELGSSDFTLEGWFYWTGTLTGWTLFYKASSFELKSDTSRWVWQLNAASNVFITSFTPIANQWYHIALVRTTTTTKLYVNGVLFTSGTSVNANDNSNPLYIGYGSAPFIGYASDIRITTAALYTSNFYPGPAPATPTTTIGTNRYSSSLLVNGTSGGIIDVHGNNNFETFGNVTLASENPYEGSYYSNYFDGTDDALTTSSISHAGNFTIEFWMNTSAALNPQRFPSMYVGGTSLYIQYDHENNPGDKLRVVIGSLLLEPTTTITPNVWHHVALVRSGSTVTLYCDGVSLASGTDSTTVGGTVSISAASTLAWAGYLSNLRVINGTALYTTAFTPPTSPLTAVSGTQLLTCQSNRYRDNSTNNYTLTRTGNVLVSSFNPFRQNTGKSLYFDGTGDYLVGGTNRQTLNFGTGDFCVEFWLKTTATAFTVIGNTGASWQVVSTGSSLYWVIGYNTANLMSRSLSGYLDNAWHHFMIRRASGVTFMYFDGVQQGAGVSDTNNYAPTATIGVGYTGAVYSAMNGYIADLRVTKGNARTANTAPTSAYSTK